MLSPFPTQFLKSLTVHKMWQASVFLADIPRFHYTSLFTQTQQLLIVPCTPWMPYFYPWFIWTEGREQYTYRISQCSLLSKSLVAIWDLLIRLCKFFFKLWFCFKNPRLQLGILSCASIIFLFDYDFAPTEHFHTTCMRFHLFTY